MRKEHIIVVRLRIYLLSFHSHVVLIISIMKKKFNNRLFLYKPRILPISDSTPYPAGHQEGEMSKWLCGA